MHPMSHTRKRFIPLLAAILPVVVAAAGRDAGFSGWLGVSAMVFDYEETDARGVLDREEGEMPGLDGGLRLEHGSWFAETGLTWWSGTVDYESLVPPVVISKTDEDILAVGLLVGRQVWDNGANSLHLVGGGGYRDWQRNIRSVPGVATGLDENYTWWYGALGVRAARVVDTHTRVQADLLLTHTIEPEIEVDFHGAFDTATAGLGDETGFRIAITLERVISRTATLRLSPWYEYREFGRSRDVPLFIGGVPSTSGGLPVTFVEPDSETRNLGINLGLVWRPGTATKD